MNIKKILILLIFAIAIIGIITPTEAKIDSNLELEKSFMIKDNKFILYVSSDIGMKSKNHDSVYYANKRKTELNKINKAVVKIEGYEKNITFKKPSQGWKLDKYAYSIEKTFPTNVDTDKVGFDYSIKFYDKKNKLLKNKKGNILFSDLRVVTGINKNPKKYFDNKKTQNMKKPHFYFKPFKQTHVEYNDEVEIIFDYTSSVNYYYNKDSKFMKLKQLNRDYSSHLVYKTKKMEKSKSYTNGKYTLIIDTYKNEKYGIFKHLTLTKAGYELHPVSIKNPYFNISKSCNWTNPTIKKLAKAIKANVTISNHTNKDIYNMELANAVIRYIHTNIKYDTHYSLVQSDIATLNRGKGNCMGGSMLAGALLRALGIPTYFESSQNYEEGHIWPVSYIFYNNSYQWVPAETTTYIDDDGYDINLEEYKYPFQKNALDRWINDWDGKYFLYKVYGYNYDY